MAGGKSPFVSALFALALIFVSMLNLPYVYSNIICIHLRH